MHLVPTQCSHNSCYTLLSPEERTWRRRASRQKQLSPAWLSCFCSSNHMPRSIADLSLAPKALSCSSRSYAGQLWKPKMAFPRTGPEHRASRKPLTTAQYQTAANCSVLATRGCTLGQTSGRIRRGRLLTGHQSARKLGPPACRLRQSSPRTPSAVPANLSTPRQEVPALRIAQIALPRLGFKDLVRAPIKPARSCSFFP